jgi:undecaprenyl-diphosphatase
MPARSGAANVRTSTRRNASDLLRLVLGVLLLSWSAVAAVSGEPSRVELNLFRLVNQLPGAAGSPLIGIMQLGALAAVPVISAACFLSGRTRLARLVLAAGLLAWAGAKLLGAVVGQRPPDERVSGVVLHGAVTPGLAFPSTHVAVAAAIATVAGPYVSRSVRRTAWLAVLLVATARMYVGAHFPIDVLGGFALGWLLGSLMHLVLGAPRGAPDPDALREWLEANGAAVQAISATRTRGSGFRITTSDGARLHVKVVDRDRGDADWLYRLWRLVAYRDPISTAPVRHPSHAVDHEALALYTARRDGLVAPEPRWTASIADGESILVREWIEGQALDTPGVAGPDALTCAWGRLGALHRAGIAYGAAQLSGFVRTSHGDVVPVDFSRAQLRADASAMQHDIVELLASSAGAVGPALATRSARAGIGACAVADALPVLQPLALSPEGRAALRRAAIPIDELRTAVAEAAGVEPERGERPVWTLGRNLAPFVLGAVALVVLLTQLGNLSTAVSAARHADPAWLAVALACTFVGYVMSAVSLTGAAPAPLALGRTTIVQFAAAFTNRVAPAGLGAMATNIRYLERHGIRRARAATAVGLNAAAGGMVHVVLLLTLVPLAGLRTQVPLPQTPDFSDYWPIALTIIVVLSLAGLWYWRHGVGSVVERLRPHARDVRGVLDQPRRAALLFGGSLGVTLAQAFVFVCTLNAVGIHRPVLTCVAVFLAGSAIAAAAPTPGGLGALEAALVAGLGQIGVATAPAIAAVLISRVVGYWFPILPGWLAFRWSIRTGTL